MVSAALRLSQQWVSVLVRSAKERLGTRLFQRTTRSAGSAIAPQMSARVLPLAQIGEHLPADTPRIDPAARLAALQERQRAWQMRRLW